MTTATKIPEGFECKCGEFSRFSPWVYAHWLTPLVFTCSCGRRYNVRKGIAREAKHERSEGSSQRHQVSR